MMLAQRLRPCAGAYRKAPPQPAAAAINLRGHSRHRTHLRLHVRNSDEAAVTTAASLQPKQAELPVFESDLPSTSGRGDAPPGAATQLAPGSVLQGGKYTILEVLGAGSNAVAYKARDASGREVAIKALSLRALRDWKQLDLFQREGRTLAGLSHPCIPRYLDYFEEDGTSDRAFYLVQEVAQGQSLAQMVASGKRADAAEVTRIADQLLAVLQYLGSLSPPVIHRDVKPDNIVIEGGQWGGRVFLVDFGGVQAVASAGELGLGSTIVGTYGYMAPEQFRGAAQPSSDLYALGATLLFLMTGQPPSAFPQERMRINWRAVLGDAPTPALGALLDGLLEPLAEDRLTAAEARAVLAGQPLPEQAGRSARSRGGFARRREQAAGPPPIPTNAREAYAMMAGQLTGRAGVTLARVAGKPAGSRVLLERTPTRLDITIPPKGLTGDTAFTGTFAIAWNAFVAFWTFGALASGGILFALFSTPFWFAGVQLARSAFSGALLKERFAVGPQRWRLGQQLALFGNDGKADFMDDQGGKVVEGSARDLTGARVVTTAIVNDQPQTCIELLEGVNRHRFGEGLDLLEQQWLVQEINEHLEEMRGRGIDYAAMPSPEVPQIYNDTDDPEWKRRNDPLWRD